MGHNLLQFNFLNKTQVARYVVAVAAGKGGVGKSSMTVGLAQTFHKEGYSVGVLDADIYGPSLGRMMPLDEPVSQKQNALLPGLFQGVKVFSLAYLKGDEALVARAPVVNGLILECIQNIFWGDLDYLFIDLPPGTGDIHLTLMQQMLLSGVVLVTTPQEVSLLDVKKSASMFQLMGIPLLGVIENMSYFEEPITLQKYQFFGEGGGKTLSNVLKIPFLGQLPLDPNLCKSMDAGINFVKEFPDSFCATQLRNFSNKIKDLLYEIELAEEEVLQEIFVDKTKVLMKWKDGRNTECCAADLQRYCPCVVCKAATPLIDPFVEILQISQAGVYALKIRFTSGCSNGIFTFSFLRGFLKEAV